MRIKFMFLLLLPTSLYSMETFKACVSALFAQHGEDPKSVEHPPLIDSILQCEHHKTFLLLADPKVNVDEQDIGGHTALMVAAIDHQKEIIEKLCNRGANPLIRSKTQRTALDYADNESIKNLLEKYMEHYAAKTGAAIIN